MRLFYLHFILTVCLFFIYPDTVSSKATLPSGYSWQKFKDIKAKGVKPEGWSFHRKKIDGKIIYRIVKDKYERCFLTGLTINAVRNVTRKTQLNAPLYAAYYIYDYQKDSSKILNTWNTEEGPFMKYGCEVIKNIRQFKSNIDFRIKVTAIANKETDTLYVVIFGTPEKDWNHHTEIEKNLMAHIILSERY